MPLTYGQWSVTSATSTAGLRASRAARQTPRACASALPVAEAADGPHGGVRDRHRARRGLDPCVMSAAWRLRSWRWLGGRVVSWSRLGRTVRLTDCHDERDRD